MGKRLGKKFKEFKRLIEQLDSDTIDQFQKSGELRLNDEDFVADDILIFREAMAGTNAVSDRFISIDMDCTLNDELIMEGLAREVINRIQKSRKDSGLNVSDRINLTINASDLLLDSVKAHENHIKRETLIRELEYSNDVLDLSFDIDDEQMSISLSLFK